MLKAKEPFPGLLGNVNSLTDGRRISRQTYKTHGSKWISFRETRCGPSAVVLHFLHQTSAIRNRGRNAAFRVRGIRQSEAHRGHRNPTGIIGKASKHTGPRSS